jgi:catechol 2,3-dioxygenase-like lactoylglutathione lyase family enzyme
MFSHVMVGSNDIARSKKFYDALFGATGGEPGALDAKGRLIYAHNGGRFAVSKPIDGKAATHANGGTIGFYVGKPGTGPRLAQSRSGERRLGDRGPTGRTPRRHRFNVSRLPSRSRRQQAMCGSFPAGGRVNVERAAH